MNKKEVKIINEEYRKLFPELAESLEREGLLQQVLIDDYGFTHDGEKRRLLLGLDQIKELGMLKNVPIESLCSNITPNSLKNEVKELIVKDLHTQYINTLSNDNGKYNFYQEQELALHRSNHAFVKMCMKRYGVSESTVYRWIDPSYYEDTQTKKKAKAERATIIKRAKEVDEKACHDKYIKSYGVMVETAKKVEKEKVEAEEYVISTHTESINLLMNWLDVDNPKIDESERNLLLALKDILNDKV